ncbi:MAG: DUF488 domain-containing protein [Planctomycetota bacterium]
MTRRAILTVGYSTHAWEAFVALLRGGGVTAVADVRSHPTARLPEYRRETLAARLRCEGIAYVFLGRELGARREERECYVDGRADYDRIARLPAFREGIARLERGAADGHVIALMCAEREPLDCHRGVLISRVLTSEGWEVSHLLPDGSVEPHAETEQRLIARMGVDPLLDGEADRHALITRAYRERAWEIAYRRDD